MRRALLVTFVFAAAVCAPVAAYAEAPPTPLTVAQRTAFELAGPYTLMVGRPDASNQRQRQSVMLREERTIELKPGKSTVEWADLPDSAITETATMLLTGIPNGVRILGVRFVEVQMTQAALGAALRGMPVTATVTANDGERPMYGVPPRNPKMTRTVRGSLVSLAGGVVLEVGQELTVLPPASIQTPAVAPRSKLLVDVDVPASAAPLRTSLELTVLVENVTMHGPHYTMQVNEATGRASLTGSLLVSNSSGYALDGARAFYIGHTFRPQGGSLRFRADEPTGVASTWGTALTASTPHPFALPSVLGTAPQGIVDTPVVAEADVPVAPSNYVRLTGMNSLTERQENPELLPIVRVFELDLSRRAPGLALPGGTTVVLASYGQGPALPLAEGNLEQRDAKTARVVAQTSTWGLRVEAKQLATKRTSKCTAVTSVRYAIPRKAIEVAPFELQVPFSKKEVAVTLGKEATKDGVTLQSTQGETTIHIPKRAPSTAKAGTDDDYVLRVDYKANDCSR